MLSQYLAHFPELLFFSCEQKVQEILRNEYLLNICLGSALPQCNLHRNFVWLVLKSTFYKYEDEIGLSNVLYSKNRKHSKGESVVSGHLKFYTFRTQLMCP